MMKRLILLLLLLNLSGFAANATPVTISSITVSGNSATATTATAHALIVNQGVCLAAPSSMCGVVTNISDSTHFTATLSAAIAACVTSCGTSFPAPQAIALSTPVQDQGHTNFTYALWLTSTQSCPTSATSAWKVASGSVGASTSQLNAIASGLFVEKIKTVAFPANYVIANIQTYIQNDYTMEQQALSTNIQPCQFYGFVFDNVGWAKQ